MTNTLDIYIRAHGSYSRHTNGIPIRNLENNFKVYFYHDHGFTISGQAADAIMLGAITKVPEPRWRWIYPREDKEGVVPDYRIDWYDYEPTDCDHNLDMIGDEFNLYAPPFVAGILAVGSDGNKRFWNSNIDELTYMNNLPDHRGFPPNLSKLITWIIAPNHHLGNELLETFADFCSRYPNKNLHWTACRSHEDFGRLGRQGISRGNFDYTKALNHRLRIMMTFQREY